MSMKNLKGPTENQTHDLPDCSAVPQPTVPPINRLKYLGHLQCSLVAILTTMKYNILTLHVSNCDANGDRLLINFPDMFK
jgi:hypothetical protein